VAQTGLTVSGTCETGLTVNLSGTGMSSATTTTCSAGAFSAAITFSAVDGTKNIIASQTDSVGNTSSDNRNFVRDTTAPVIAITSPAVNTVAQTGLTVSGTCETGLTVNLSGTGLLAASTATCSAGAFSAAITFSAIDGTKNIIASQTDSVGNTSSDNRNFVKDTTAPAIAITLPLANTVAQTGLTVSGTCETGLTINLSGTGLSSATTATCSAGAFSAAITFSAVDGIKNIIASQTDSVGNTSSDNRNFVKDTTAPAIAITLPLANTVAQTGLTVSGTCETGLTVNLSGTGLSSATTTSCSAGAFSAAITFSAVDGTKNIIASQTDSVGNTSSDNRNFVKDNTAPALAISSPTANFATQATINLAGTCETGLTVNLSGTGIFIDTTTPCLAGAFAQSISLSAIDGSKLIVATQTDSVGNTSTASRTFILDTIAPAIQITSPAANTVAQTGLTVSGTCETGLTVNLSGTGLSSATTTTCSAGSFSAVITFSAIDGTKNIIASQTDSVGNTSSDNRNFVKDTTAPVIAITSPAANTVAKTGLTVSGACETGLTVNLSGTGLSSATTTTCSAGAFSAAITFSAVDGTKNIIASQTDSVGNTSSDNRNFVKDTTAPAIAISSPAANTVAQTGLTVSGTCETGLTVNLSGTGLLAATTTTCSAGAFSAAITFSAVDGTKNIIASQTDSVGNTSSDNRNFVKDTTAPVIAITLPAANTVAQTGLTVSGTCETGLNVNLSGTGLLAATTTTCSAGAFSAAITFSAVDGTKNIIASQTDSVGNTSSDNRNFVKDSTAPIIAITSPAANTTAQTGLTVSGTCETGISVVLWGTGVSANVTTTCSSGTFSAAILYSAGEGAKDVRASQTDLAGNFGTSTRNFIKDSVAPAIAITSPANNSYVTASATLAGTCESGLIVDISGAGILAPTSTTCSSGVFSVSISFAAGDGTKNIIASQTDSATNTASSNRDFIRDTIAPIIAITSPAAGTSTATGLTISGTCETGLTVDLSGDLSGASTTSCTAGSFSANILFSVGNGNKNVIAAQTDGAGNSGSDNRNFTKANTAGYEVFTSKGPGGKVDILFVDDNSASMDAEQAALGSRFASFASSLSGVDWQAGIITTDCTAGSVHNHCGELFNLTGRPAGEYILAPTTPSYLSVFQNTIQRPETTNCLLSGTCPSGKEEGLKSAIQSFALRNTTNAGFYRADADLAIVILSDEDEQSNAPATATKPSDLIASFKATWGNTKILSSYGIIVKPGDTACWNAQRLQLGANANYGTYPDLLATLTGGLSVSICEPDYSLTLTQIGLNVSQMSKSIDLANTPIAGTVSVVFTPSFVTTWSVVGNRITFTTPAPTGTTVEVFYNY
jgi:hypothetical protein